MRIDLADGALTNPINIFNASISGNGVFVEDYLIMTTATDDL